MTPPTPLVTAPPVRPVDGPHAIKRLIDRQAHLRDSWPAADAPAEVRRQHNRSLAFVTHDAMEQAHETARLWMDFNAGRTPARFLGLEGPFFHGKSDIGLSLVMATCKAVWDQVGHEVEDDEGIHTVIPAAWVVGGGTTGELELVARLMNFMGLPALRNRAVTVGSGLTELAGACRRSRTQLIVIDDAHQFPSSRGVGYTKFLKQCFEMLPVTLMFIAKDLDETYILKPSGSDSVNREAAEQLQMRIVRSRCGPVDLYDAGIQTWVALVDRCLQHFQLRHQPQMSGEDILWLHKRTAGNPAELVQTLITAATLATGGSERITRDEITLAHDLVSASRK